MPYIGKQPEHGRFAKVDQINSGFDGSAVTFNLTVDSVAVYPTNPQNLLISIGGVIQQPGTDYTVSAATITLTSAPAASTDFFGVLLGDVLDIGTPSDGSVTVSKMAVNSVDSDQYVDGSIDTVHIDALQITGAKIAANTITGDKIALGSDAQGDVMYYNGTDWVRLGFGTSGHFLKTQGTGANPVWAAAGGGGLVFIDTAVASTSSILEVTLTGSYETYLITGSDLKPGTDVVDLRGQFGASGSWTTSGYKNAFHRIRSDSTHDMATGATGFIQLSSTIGNATGEGVGFAIWFTRPIGTADVYPLVHGNMIAVNHSTIVEAGQITGFVSSNVDIARFKIYLSSGNFTSGRLTVWGLVHA